jgi:hypothetical protein
MHAFVKGHTMDNFSLIIHVIHLASLEKITSLSFGSLITRLTPHCKVSPRPTKPSITILSAINKGTITKSVAQVVANST